MDRHKREAFPAGLYGMLLFALCCLTLPAVFAPIERLLVGVACLVPRAVVLWTGAPAEAASPPDASAPWHTLAADLQTRIRDHDLEVGSVELQRDFEPILCGVIASERRGGGGQPSELRLDHRYADLADCSDIVTKGNVLVGFLQKAGRGYAADDAPEDQARVLLLNHSASAAVAGVVDLRDGGSLRMVVKPAATIDPAPLRVDLWDDPYRAANLTHGGDRVMTMALPSMPEGPPAGLWLGRTRIWGYEAAPGVDPLTIGVYVVPPIEPRALSHVVVWRRRAGKTREPHAEPEVARDSRHPATVWDLPGAAQGRHLLSTDCSVPDGAAVVQDGVCLGTARGLAFGLGLVTSFSASRQRWNLLFLPTDASARPREITGYVVQAADGVAYLQWHGDSIESVGGRLPAGYLFTGSNGPHCPAGLFVGSAQPASAMSDLLEITTVPQRGARTAEIVVGGGR